MLHAFITTVYILEKIYDLTLYNSHCIMALKSGIEFQCRFFYGVIINS
ncbi:MAG: hypothetical protein JWQ85_2310, partial [Mucilaginibacter sp.]|nr:hypothetical protein [Mucilaginibacter sp.]